MAFGYDGSIRIDTKLNSRGFNNGINGMMSSLTKLGGVIGAVFSVVAIVNFGKEAVKAASNLSSALIGLQSITEGQGRSFEQAKQFIQDYIKDGLIPMQNAVTAYKNLAMRGYSTEQIEKTMIALKDSATFGRQASLTMGHAVESATEGLKNENSILVDNAGVTKNVSVMWKEYADQLGVGVQSLTKQQKIQAEVNGIMRETRFQTGDAAKAVNTYSGQMAMLTFQFQQLKVAIGNAIIPVIQAALPAITQMIASLTELANVFAQVTTLMFGSSKTEEESKAKDDLANSTGSAADSTNDLADASEDAGKEIEKAGKKAKGALAPFDEINKLASSAADDLKNTADDMADGADFDKIGGGTMFGDVEISPEIIAFVDDLKKKLQALLDLLKQFWAPFETSWAQYGPAVMDAIKSSLSSVWELIKAIGAAFMEVWTNGAGERFLGNILTIIEGIFSFISQLADQMTQVWEEMGVQFFEAFFFALNSILELVISIGSAFVQAWNSGVGLEILRTIMSIMTEILNLVGELANRMQEAWEANGNGVAIWQSILNIILDVLSFVDQLIASTVEWAQGLNLEPIVTSFRTLLEAIEPLAAVILDSLAWAYENVLLPLASWVIEDAAPAALDLLSAALGFLVSVLESLGPLVSWLWESFLRPLAEWTGDVFVAAMEVITSLLDGFSNWIKENETIIQAITVLLGIFFAAWKAVEIAAFIINAGGVVSILKKMTDAIKAGTIAKIADQVETLKIVALYAKDFIVSVGKSIANIAKETASIIKLTAMKIANAAAQGAMTAATAAWNAIAPIATAVTTAFGAAVSFLTSPIGIVVIAITALIAIIVLLIKNWDAVSEAAVRVWETIKSAFGSAADWFNKTVIEPIKQFFRDGLNFMLSGVEGFINFFINGINKIIEALNTISFDFPDWVPLIGGKTFGIDIPKIPTVSLPRLANGAVIPPNREFAAILGDQRSGMNIETPLSTMVDAFKTALRDGGYSGGSITVEMPVYLDNREIYRGQQTVQRQIGRNFVGGV